MKNILYIVLLFTFYANSLFPQKADSIKISKQSNFTDPVEKNKKKFLYFVSNRLCEDDKYDIFKTLPSERHVNIVIIRGKFEMEGKPELKRAKFTVYNASNNKIVGIYNTSQYSGQYLMVLVPNVNYIIKVEVQGYETLMQEIQVPFKIDYEVCRQDIKYMPGQSGKPSLSINSFFTDSNEKIFYLRSSVDSTRSDAELAGYSDENRNVTATKNNSYSSIDEMVKKQLEEERKKPGEALKLFKAEKYEEARLLYEDLLKIDAAEPFYNYYHGICLIKNNIAGQQAISNLELASHYKDVPRDVFFYLAKAYHVSYIFPEAIKALEEYKKSDPNAGKNNQEVNLLLEYCRNGNKLMTAQQNIEILKRNFADEQNILSSYNPDLVNEHVMLKPEVYYSSVDKKKGEKLFMCKWSEKQAVQVSYGEKDMNGKDLLESNMGISKNLGADINSRFDENYPYVSPDGKTLYFSSNGYGSMGGYDIFKSTRQDTSSPWSKPENLGSPINSTADDILFVPEADSTNASFCTNRRNGRMEYIQIKWLHDSIVYSIIKGNYRALDSTNSRDGIVRVYDEKNEELVGVYKTNPENGNYAMILQADKPYKMDIVADGYPELASSFFVPAKKGDFILKQVARLSIENNVPALSVQNYFNEEDASKYDPDEDEPEENLAKKTEEKKNIKEPKPKRTPEEMEKDKENLAQARKLYEQSVYQEAALAFQEVELHADLDELDSYYYGMSLYNSKKDKYKCAQLLEFAANSKEVPQNVFYYLGKANQLSYRFSAALADFKHYQSISSENDIQKFHIEEEINYCNNGIRLVNNPVVVEVYEKKHVDINNIYLSLNHLESGGKLLVSPEDIISSADKKKQYHPVIYLTPDKNTIFYASYGDNGKDKDIYKISKLPGNKWSEPLNISVANSSADEEFPALSADGKTLYFSSRGFDSMGGFDIFKCEWNEATDSWGPPVNMGSPINSPYDDFFYLE